ncbi:hypothetical protein WN943_025573 [Citrus x changshan-huyou]
MATEINNFEKIDWLLENHHIFLHATVNKIMPPTLPFEIASHYLNFQLWKQQTWQHLEEVFFLQLICYRKLGISEKRVSLL